MNTLNILLQFGASLTEPLSSLQLAAFWGIVLVFVLAFLFFLYRTDRILKEKNLPVQQETAVSTPEMVGEAHDEEAAAIALAIHLYKSEMHDMESFTITLQKVSRIYSPWSSKIYTLRQNPRYK
jgi:hypothetical protein